MIDRRALLVFSAVGLAGVALVPGARALERQAFSEAAFKQAQAAKKSILVHVTAPWCPTCKAQKPIVASLLAGPKFKDFDVFEVDFDSQKAVLRGLRVQMQSTMICYKGTTEVGRETGDTKGESIAALLDKAL